MNIEVTPNGDEPTMALSGRFDAHEVGEFRDVFDRLVGPGVRVRVDLAGVAFVDSSALAELVRGMKHTREHGGDVLLVDPSDPVRVILELTGLDRAFELVSLR